MTIRIKTIRAGLLNVLAADQVVGPNGLKHVSDILARVGIDIDADTLDQWLLEESRRPFDPNAIRVSWQDSGRRADRWSRPRREYRFTHPQTDAAYQSIRACYAVTDTLPRTRFHYCGSTIERIRPAAFAACRAQLMLRWLRGNWSVPTDRTIRTWIAEIPLDAASWSLEVAA